MSRFTLAREDGRLVLRNAAGDFRMIGHVVKSRFRALAKYFSLKDSAEVNDSEGFLVMFLAVECRWTPET